MHWPINVRGIGMDRFQTESFWCHGFPHSLFPLMFLFQCFLNLWQPMSLNAAAKLLQSCPTLCNPIDGSPPGSPAPGILQARTLEWVAISFSNAWKWKVKVKSLSRVQLQRPHGLQPTRLLRSWDFPGKSTGVGCHCLLRNCWQEAPVLFHRDLSIRLCGCPYYMAASFFPQSISIVSREESEMPFMI